ncbi:ISL3 family transposase, partial [Actinotignum urinale]
MNKKRKTTFTTSDSTEILACLVSLKDVRLIGYRRDGPRQELWIEQVVKTPVRCSACSSKAVVKDRPCVRYIDLPVYGRPIYLVWRKHRWLCSNKDCGVKSWCGKDKRIACGSTTMTSRAARWVIEQVGKGRTVSEVAGELGCDWHTVNNTVTTWGKALLEADKKRVGQTTTIGLDETSFVRLNHRRTHYVTTVCDIANSRIIDIVPSRNYVDVAGFLHKQPEQWKKQIAFAALDMSPTYRAVYNVILPDAIQVADHYHVISLANRSVDQVRRRVQQETLGHRGRKNDPLYTVRRTLLCAEERLSDTTRLRLESLLDLGDPDGEVSAAYRIKEEIRSFYKMTTMQAATLKLDKILEYASRDYMPPEIQRLARTLHTWKSQILAYHLEKISNGVTESFNNLIKRIKRIGFGFTNFMNYKIRVLLYAGKPNWRILNNIF